MSETADVTGVVNSLNEVKSGLYGFILIYQAVDDVHVKVKSQTTDIMRPCFMVQAYVTQSNV